MKFSNTLTDSSHLSYYSSVEHQILDYDESIWSKLRARYPEEDTDFSSGEGTQGEIEIDEQGELEEGRRHTGNRNSQTLTPRPTFGNDSQIMEPTHNTMAKYAENDDATLESSDEEPSMISTPSSNTTPDQSDSDTTILDYNESCWAELQSKYSDGSDDGDDEEDGEEDDGEGGEAGTGKDNHLNEFNPPHDVKKATPIILDYDESIWSDLQREYSASDSEEGPECVTRQVVILKMAAPRLSVRVIEEKMLKMGRKGKKERKTEGVLGETGVWVH